MPRPLCVAGPLLALCAVAAQARGADWPQFRGPGGQGHAPAASLPLEWDREKNVDWWVEVPGKGWSSPIVVDGRVYLTTAVANGASPRSNDGPQSLRAICLDATTGETLWNVEVFRQESTRIHRKNSHASPTPIVDGGQVFVHFGTHGTAALTVDGKVVWRNSSVAYPPVHGSGGSPALVGNRLIFSCDGAARPFVIALDRRTGRPLWRTPRPAASGNRFAFSTPVAIEVGGRIQVVLPGAHHVVSYDPGSGEEVWRVAYPGGFSVVPRPVFAHGLVFVSSGFMNAVLYAIRPDGRGDVTDTHVAWTEGKSIARNASFLVVGDEVYVVSDNGIASCFDVKTGRRHWRKRLGGAFTSSPLHAAGRIYFLNEDGETTVVAAGRASRELARNPLDEQTQASAAVAGNALFVRTLTRLYRIVEGAGRRR
jgi:outer membrane protein assembly factor BamB